MKHEFRITFYMSRISSPAISPPYLIKVNRFKGEIVPAVREVIEKGIIRIVDLVFVKKDAADNISFFELWDIDDIDLAIFDKNGSDITGLLIE